MDTNVHIVEQSQYLTFKVTSTLYAIGILRVKEIITYRAPTKVPMTPDYVSGVINLRGNVVPVVDLGMKFGSPEVPPSKRTCIIIADIDLGEEQIVMGIVVEAVSAVVDLGPTEVEEVPTFGTGISTEYLQGMGKLKDELVPILDLDRILSSDGSLASILSERGGDDVNADRPGAVGSAAAPE